MNKCILANGCVFFPSHSMPKCGTVMRRLGVKKKTYAGRMISRTYDYYFHNGIDIHREYKKYYKKEFASEQLFVEEKYDVDQELAKRVTQRRYCIKEYRACIDKLVENLNYDRGFDESFSHAVGGIERETEDRVYYE